MNEKELVKRAQAGDFDAFNSLINEHKERIYRLALKLTGNKEDAEDVMQETFLKAIDNIEKFRMEASFGTWIYTIALNTIRAGAGKKKQMTLKPIEEYLPSGHTAGAEELVEWGDPHELAENRELRELIDEALSQMDYKYSMPFALRYIEEMPVAEVAKMMKLTVPATKSRILRARLAMRDWLSEAFKENKSGKM